ncbi:hypothetical protein niasHT_005215 [Heterodera trifolii]|uniref:PKD/REJ-like domain-containing protein n=1 Tax=Heterodera trifolii TaxID=157864 RepID=A0ABD2LSW0_9BILA
MNRATANEVSVFDDFHSDIEKSKKINKDRLSKFCPKLFKKENGIGMSSIASVPFEALLAGEFVFPCSSIHSYVHNAYKSKNPGEIADELELLLDKLTDFCRSDSDFEKILNFSLVLSDCFGRVFFDCKSPELNMKLLRMQEKVKNLTSAQFLFAQNIALIKNKAAFVPSFDDCSDYIPPMKHFLDPFCLFPILFWFANYLSAEYSYLDDYQETCKLNSHCPDLMHCKDALCACDVGLSFSHSLSKCERAKENFTDFDIQGPSAVNLSIGKVELKAVIREKWKHLNWTYSWTILNGIDNGRFSGMDGPLLTLTELKPGFVQLTLSVSNDSSEGYMLRDLIITEARVHPIRIVECDKHTNVNSVRLWLPRDNKLRLCTVTDKAVSYKWVRVDHSLRPIDIFGSTSSILELSNFQMANESAPYEFILSVSFENGHSYNSTVKLFVHEYPQIPVIYAQNLTVNLRADSVMLKAHISNGSADVFLNFTWMQTDGPSRVDLANRHSLSSASIVGPFNASGLYSFRVRAVTIAEDVVEAALFVNVLPEKDVQLRPIVPSNNFSVVLPKKFVFLKSNYCRNGDIFTWEPDGRVPAVMLLQSDFHGQRLFLGHLLPGIFTFRLFCNGQLGNGSTIVQLEVKRGKEIAPFSLDVAIRREQTDDESFSIREQRNILETMEENLQQHLGGAMILNVDNIFYDRIGGILILRVKIARFLNFGRMEKIMIESKMVSILRNNETFLERFKIVSVSPTTACYLCENDTLSTTDFFGTIFSFIGGKNSRGIFYASVSIIAVFVFFFKGLHLFWLFQEGERKIEKLEKTFCAIGWTFATCKGRFSPIPSLRKPNEKLVNKTLMDDDSETLLDNELSDSASNYEEEEGEEIHPTKRIKLFFDSPDTQTGRHSTE